MSKEEIKALAEDNAIYEFRKFQKIYGSCTDEYVRYFYNKLAELRGGIDDNHTCSCQHNSNSRDNEPCCKCDSRRTNADRIRNMPDEELAELITGLSKHCLAGIGECDCSAYETCTNCNVKVRDWLQSEAE